MSLSSDWALHTSRSSGKTYYFNKRTGESTYECPPGLPPIHTHPLCQEPLRVRCSPSASSSKPFRLTVFASRPFLAGFGPATADDSEALNSSATADSREATNGSATADSRETTNSSATTDDSEATSSGLGTSGLNADSEAHRTTDASSHLTDSNGTDRATHFSEDVKKSTEIEPDPTVRASHCLLQAFTDNNTHVAALPRGASGSEIEVLRRGSGICILLHCDDTTLTELNYHFSCCR